MKVRYQFLLFAVTLFLSLTLFHYHPSSLPQHLQAQFQQWVQHYHKKYHSTTEYHYRLSIFAQNKIKVQAHNLKAHDGEFTYFLKLNSLADQTKYQYKIKNLFSFKKLNEKSIQKLKINTHSCNGTISDAPNPPQKVDWSEKAVVTSVYTQKADCPANYAFASTGAVQGLYYLKQSKLTKLSDQQLIDCSGDYGNEGCGGGFMEQAFWYIIDHGLATNDTYPYIGAESQKCKYSLTDKYAKFSRCAKIPSGNYSKLLSATVQQPVAVSVDSADFQLYSHGIFNDKCGTQIDRGMLLVGYGSQSNSSYWKVKNSHGTQWGQNGYIRLEKLEEDGPGKCGIQLAASVPQGLV